MKAPGSTHGLPSLQREPDRLRSEAQDVQRTLESLYKQNYVIFIENRSCMAFLGTQGTAFRQITEGLQGDLQALKGDCKAFEGQADEIVVGLKRNRQTLQHHLQLVELLEVPQLMDACIRNGLYEEAVDLVAFANTLERRHMVRGEPVKRVMRRQHTSGDADAKEQRVVIASIVKDLRGLQVQLREKLLLQLRLPIQLPRCLQVISCLRKLDGLALEEQHIGTSTKPTEEEQCQLEHRLQVEFLEARDAWLQSVMTGGSDGLSGSGRREQVDVGRGAHSRELGGSLGAEGRHVNLAQHLMDVVEKDRTHWFEIATQFRAIFLDDDVRGSGSKTLSAWLLSRITGFLAELQRRLTDGAALVDVLEQCMFFGASMGRIGVDFRELLVPVFSSAIKELANLHWTAAVAELVAILQRCHAEGHPEQHHPHQRHGGGAASMVCYVVPGAVAPAQAQVQGQPNGPSKVSTPMADAEEQDGPRRRASTDGSTVATGSLAEQMAPPMSILTYPPLAQFTNLLLTSYNQLRQCSPWGIVDDLENLFLEHMHDAVKALAAHRSVEKRNAGPYRQLCEEALKVVMPYLVTCFELMLYRDGERSNAKVAQALKQVDSWSLSEGVLAE